LSYESGHEWRGKLNNEGKVNLFYFLLLENYNIKNCFVLEFYQLNIENIIFGYYLKLKPVSKIG